MKREIITLLCLFSSAYSLSYTVTSKIYMDVKINKKPAGRMVFGLFGEEAPKTVNNFRHICLKGINGTTYIGSKFHRIIDRFMIQGGDIVSGNGLGTTSIYGDYFEDENLSIEHLQPGYLGMANRGPNTNGCQFYVTSVTARWLDGKHVVFGKLIEGMDTLFAIESVKTDTEDFPLQPVVISNCGEMPTEPYQFYPDEYNIMGWIKAAGPALVSSICVLGTFHYFYRQLSKYC